MSTGNTSANVTDKDVSSIVEALKPYNSRHPAAVIDVRRRCDSIVRVRIVDPDFRGMDRVEREDEPWSLLENLPEDVVTQITMVILVTPDEKASSFASMEFDDPTPWPEVTSSR